MGARFSLLIKHCSLAGTKVFVILCALFTADELCSAESEPQPVLQQPSVRASVAKKKKAKKTQNSKKSKKPQQAAPIKKTGDKEEGRAANAEQPKAAPPPKNINSDDTDENADIFNFGYIGGVSNVVQATESVLLNIASKRSNADVAQQEPAIVQGRGPSQKASGKAAQAAAKPKRGAAVAELVDIETISKQQKRFSEEFVSVKKDAPKPASLVLEIPPVKATGESAQKEKSAPEAATIPASTYNALPVSVIKTTESPKFSLSGDCCSYVGTVRQDNSNGSKDGDCHMGWGWADLCCEAVANLGKESTCKFASTCEFPSSTLGVKELYFEFATPYGTMVVGDVKGPDGTTLEDGSVMVGGTGGTDGSFCDMFNMPPGIPNFQHLSGYSKRATKVAYYSPRVSGLQLALGYSPNPNHFGWGGMGDRDYSGGADDSLFSADGMSKRNNVTVGLNFSKATDNVELKTAVVALNEKTTISIPINREISDKSGYGLQGLSVNREIPLNSGPSYQASASLRYKNVTLATGWINNGSLNLPSSVEEAAVLSNYGLPRGDSGRVWNVGGKCSFGAMEVGIAYNKAKRNITEMDATECAVTSATVECTVTPGLKLFMEANRIKAQASARTAALYGDSMRANSGTTIMIGSKICF
ncbi:MAG: porin [Holosporales bacterium]|jgi:predicted porin|nr:porin [Holosporales bacterium]